MSKITIPLLMIFAAVGLIALAKLDRDRQEHRQLWPAKGRAPTPEPDGEVPPAKPVPIELPERLSGEEFERLTNRELSNIRLLPVAEGADPVSFLWPTDGNDGPAHLELLPFARRASFDTWRSFTDEHIGFYYPDAPGIEVEVLGPEAPLPLLAETLLPPGPAPFRRYRISAGDTGSLCVISLSRAGGFDDAPRAPQAEAFHRFTPGGSGGLLRTSFTGQGQVRRMELLDSGVRASLIDWPHLAVHQDVYLRIGSSMQLAGPHENFKKLAARAKVDYALEGKLGFLDHGISESEIIATLGPPFARDEQHSSLVYLRDQDGDIISYRIGLKRGMFAGFGSDWREVVRAVPDEGSVRWMFEKTDYRAGDEGGIGYNLGALTDEDAKVIFDRFVELAPEASEPDWSQLCGVIANLAQHGLRDPRVTEIVRVRLESGEGDPQASLLALEACDNDFAKAAIAEHIIARLTSSDVPPDTLEHIYTLITYLGRGHPATAQLIDRAISHGSAPVRELGYQFCTWLPEKFALPHLEAGLRDPSTEVRRCSARAFALSHGDPAVHPEMLAARLRKESDAEVRQLLQEGLQRLGALSQ